jgi:hypothetical protein
MIKLDSLYVRHGRFTNPHHENDKERKLAAKGLIDEHVQQYYENGGKIEQISHTGDITGMIFRYAFRYAYTSVRDNRESPLRLPLTILVYLY